MVKHEIPRASGLGMTEREEGPLDEAWRQALSKLDPESQRLARKYPCAQGECIRMHLYEFARWLPEGTDQQDIL